MKTRTIVYAVLLSLIILPGYRYLIQGLNEVYLAIAVIALCCLAGVFSPYSLMRLNEVYPKIILPRQPWYYLAFVGSGILSVIFSTWSQGSLADAKLWWICIILFVAVINLPLDHRAHVLSGLLITGLVYNAAKLYRVGEILLGRSDLRLQQPNNTAGFVNLILIISLAAIIQKKDSEQKPWAWLGLGSSLIILWFTGSRGGMIAGMIGLAVVLLISWLDDPGVFKYPGLVAVGDLVGSGLFIYTGFLNRAAAVFTDASTTITTRFEIWDFGLDLFKNNKLLGSGINTFYYQVLAVNPAADPVQWIHPHSLYIKILAERGLVGLLTGSLLLLIILYSLFLYANNTKLKAVGLAVVAVMIVHGLVDLPWYEPFVMRPMIILLALSLAPPGPSCQIDE